MNDSDKARVFSQIVDQLLEGHGEVPEEMGEMLTLAAWLMERREDTSPRFRDELEGKLRQRWQEEYHSPPLRERRWRWPMALPDLGLGRRLVWIGALVGVILIGLAITVRPGIEVAVASAFEQTWTLILQRVGVREVSRVEPPVRDEEGGVREYATLAEAQARVVFPIRVPSHLPPGFRLEGVQVFSPSDVALNYRWDGEGGGRGQVELLSVREYRPEAGPDIFEVGEGVSEEISLGGRRAILVLGRGWANGRRWRRDRGHILVWDEGDRVFALWSTLSREEIIRIASSMIQQGKGGGQ